jgi:nitronate monooxygenase
MPVPSIMCFVHATYQSSDSASERVNDELDRAPVIRDDGSSGPTLPGPRGENGVSVLRLQCAGSAANAAARRRCFHDMEDTPGRQPGRPGWQHRHHACRPKSIANAHELFEDIMWPRTELLELLGVTHPIIQAPMAGFAGPALVTAVSGAGGLGSLGSGPLPINVVRSQIEEIRRTSSRPFNVNFYVHRAPRVDAHTADRVRARLAFYYGLLGLGAVPVPSDPLPSFDDGRLQLVLELRPPVISFHFGLPSAETIARIKRAGCVVLSSATTVSEAKALEAQGADAIIAQGAEAGGHRSTFTSGDGAGLIGTMALVPQVVDAVRVPVIAAGGIADGRAIAAAFALGASGVQIGTAFLGCPEAAISVPYREALRRARDEDTRLTRVFTGRPARALRNRMIDEIGDAEVIEFPAQLSLTSELAQAASGASRTDFMPLWAGQAVPLMRDLPAATLIEMLVAESRQRLPRPCD